MKELSVRRLFTPEQLRKKVDDNDVTIHDVNGQVTDKNDSGSGSSTSRWSDSLLFVQYKLLNEYLSGRRRKSSKLPWVAVSFNGIFIGLHQLCKGRNSSRKGHGQDRKLIIGFAACKTAEVPMVCRTMHNGKMTIDRDVVKVLGETDKYEFVGQDELPFWASFDIRVFHKNASAMPMDEENVDDDNDTAKMEEDNE